MKTQRVALESLAERANLTLATWKAARGKTHRPDVARFTADLDANLDRLARDILEGRAPLGRDRRFSIRDPKPRTITAPCFPDRVLHHAILNRTEARFERTLVDSSFACRPGKGVHTAVAAVQRMLRRSEHPWIVRVDIDGYFPSIDHARLRAIIARRFRGAGFLALVDRILAAGSRTTPGRGLPIGSLTSQHFANLFLDRADRFLLETLGVGAHVRYMDDIAWSCPSAHAARRSLAVFEAFVREALDLTVKAGAHIGPARRGLVYCGFRVRPGVVLPSPRKLRRYRARRRQLARAERLGLASEDELRRASDALLATLDGTTSDRFRGRVERAVLG